MAKPDILAKLGLDDTEYNKKLNAATKKLKRTTNNLTREGRRLSIVSRDLFLGLTLPMGILAKNIFNATAEMQKMTRGLATIAKSSGITAIAQLTEKTQELAKLPGLGLKETFKAVTQLIAVGTGAQKSLDIVEGIGIGIARAGGAASEFGSVMRQMIQGLSKGTLQMQDFRTVFEQLTEGRRIIEEAFGPGMSDLEKLRSAGIPVAAVVEALATGFRKLGAEGFMDSLSNQSENLADSWLKLRATVGQELFGSSFTSILEMASIGMDNMTKSVMGMSAATKASILKWTKLVGGFALFVPIAGFVASRILLMGGLLTKYSKIIRAAVIGAGLLVGKTGKMGIAFALLGKRLKFLVPFLGEIFLAIVVLKNIFPKLGTAIDDFGKELKGNRQATADVARGYTIMGQKTSFLKQLWRELARGTWKARTETDKIALRIGKANRILEENKEKVADSVTEQEAAAKAAKEWAEMLARLKGEMGGARDAAEEATKKFVINASALQGMRRAFESSLGVDLNSGGSGFAQAGAQRSGAGMGSAQEDAQRLFKNDRNNNFGAAPGIISGMGHALESIDQERMAEMKDFLARIQSWVPSEGFSRFSEMMAGGLGEGIAGVSDAFGEFFATVLTGGENALKSFGESFKGAVKSMIVGLIKLIVKLGIAAALMAIVFPGGGGLSGLAGSGKTLNGKKTGFLKGLFGALGIPGFAGGGIVGGNSPHGDKVMARLNSGEMVLNKGQQAAVSAAMASNNVHLTGKFEIKGRDLVYVVENNQSIINGLR